MASLEARVDWWCLRHWSWKLVGEGTGGGWVFGKKFDLGEFKRKVTVALKRMISIKV